MILMSHVTKLDLTVIMYRIRARQLSELSNIQYGFMSDRGSRNTMVVLGRFVKQTIEKQMMFISFTTAMHFTQ